MPVQFLPSLVRDTPEWDAAWAVLEAKYGSTVEEDPETGERWQYMCSFIKDGQSYHEFRHRQHPRLKRRVTEHFPITPTPVQGDLTRLP